MTVLRTAVNTNSPEYIAAAEAMETKLAEVNAETAKALAAAGRNTLPVTMNAESYWRGSASSC
ncbi:Pobable propionyl-CoA carboxylase beta subunit AccD2 [Mycobacteroides abscessus]|nr:Pobable propionyl-CoA carboxylase beta subunit AccD2 [Mycobacteroides abscessus]